MLVYLKLKSQLEKLFNEEDGMGTLEVVIIIAVLLGLAFLLKGFVFDLFGKLKNDINNSDKIKNIMAVVWQQWC